MNSWIIKHLFICIHNIRSSITIRACNIIIITMIKSILILNINNNSLTENHWHQWVTMNNIDQWLRVVLHCKIIMEIVNRIKWCHHLDLRLVQTTHTKLSGINKFQNYQVVYHCNIVRCKSRIHQQVIQNIMLVTAAVEITMVRKCCIKLLEQRDQDILLHLKEDFQNHQVKIKRVISAEAAPVIPILTNHLTSKEN